MFFGCFRLHSGLTKVPFGEVAQQVVTKQIIFLSKEIEKTGILYNLSILKSNTMQTKTVTIDAQDYFGDFHNPDPFMSAKDGYEAYRQWPGDLSSGFFYLFKIRPGLILSIMNHKVHKPLSIGPGTVTACFLLSFTLTGKIFALYNDGQSSRDNIIYNPNKCYLSYMPGGCGTADYLPTTPFCAISILIEPWLMSDLLEEQNDRCALNAPDFAGKAAADKFLNLSLDIPPIVNMKLHEILGCPYRGKLKKLFLEGKTLELIAHTFSQLESKACPHEKAFGHLAFAPDFVHEVRDILIKNMQNPPSLSDLCRQVGVNKNKLCSCFRQAYGTSVFNYLRICRLERSKELLASGGKKVTEVAFEVGYAQQSNFTKEFKKYFGTSPRKHLA